MLSRSINLGLTSVFNAQLVIANNVNNYNLSAALQSLGWSVTKRARVEIIINAGVTVGSASTATPALLVNLKDVDYVTVINNGNIFGRGGSGGTGAATSNGGAGGAGGTALQALSNVRVINNGIIGGGGGGNGAAGASRVATVTGYTYSWTGSCPSGRVYNPNNIVTGAICGTCQGSTAKISSVAAPCNANPIYSYSYPAGAAGTAGTAGAGVAGTAGASPWYTGGTGGAAGKYYQGLSKITIITAGTVRGTAS